FVILTVATGRNRREDGNAAFGPDGSEPARLGKTNFADISQIVFGVLLLAGAKDAAVSAAKTDRRRTGGGNGRDQALVDDAGEHHQGHIASFGIGYAQSVDEVTFF